MKCVHTVKDDQLKQSKEKQKGTVRTRRVSNEVLKVEQPRPGINYSFNYHIVCIEQEPKSKSIAIKIKPSVFRYSTKLIWAGFLPFVWS